MRLLMLVSCAAILSPISIEAQVLGTTPAAFADPRPGNAARYGDVVLGRTTLTAALRMFADDLHADSVTVTRGHVGNPAPVAEGTAWDVAGRQVEPRRRLDLGPDHYVLYFDEHDRLIAAITRQPMAALTLAGLRKHYPGLVRGRRWYGGDQPRFDVWYAALDACVTMSAHVLVADDRVEQVSYLYACPTESSPAAGQPMRPRPEPNGSY